MPPRMMSMSDMRAGASGDGDKKKKGNEYYAGGERSGVAVEGRPEKGAGADAAGFAGAEALARAGGTGEDVGEARVVAAKIVMYDNGFIVEIAGKVVDGPSGPLRSEDSAEGKAFFDQLKQGVVPKEIHAAAVEADGGLLTGEAKFDLGLDNKRGEEWTPPPEPKYLAYSGEGNSLGGGGGGDGLVLGGGDGGDVVVDESQPKTTLQLRHADGTKQRATLNHTHTVADLERLIRKEKGGGGGYMLLAGFPPKPLTDANQTIKDAGLIGAAITVKSV